MRALQVRPVPHIPCGVQPHANVPAVQGTHTPSSHRLAPLQVLLERHGPPKKPVLSTHWPLRHASAGPLQLPPAHSQLSSPTEQPAGRQNPPRHSSVLSEHVEVAVQAQPVSPAAHVGSAHRPAWQESCSPRELMPQRMLPAHAHPSLLGMQEAATQDPAVQESSTPPGPTLQVPSVLHAQSLLPSVHAFPGTHRSPWQDSPVPQPPLSQAHPCVPAVHPSSPAGLAHAVRVPSVRTNATAETTCCNLDMGGALRVL